MKKLKVNIHYIWRINQDKKNIYPNKMNYLPVHPICDWLTDWLTDLLADWLTDWLTHSLTYSLTDSLFLFLRHTLT